MADQLRDLVRLFAYSEMGVNLVIMNVAGHVLNLGIEFPDSSHCGGVGL